MTQTYDLDFQKGAFLTLKSANMVEKHDIDKYNNYSYNILKMQGAVMFFFTFWARILDVGNVVPGFKTYRYGYYGMFISVPAILHAIYAGSTFTKQTENLDRKYTKMFLEFHGTKKEVENEQIKL